MQIELTRDIAKISSDIGDITEYSHVSLVQQLVGSSDISMNGEIQSIIFSSEKGSTAFSTYRSFFWEHAKNRLEDRLSQSGSEQKNIAKILDRIMCDYNAMDFLIQLSLVKFPVKMEFSKVCDNQNPQDIISNWKQCEGVFSHFAYLLANY